VVCLFKLASGTKYSVEGMLNATGTERTLNQLYGLSLPNGGKLDQTFTVSTGLRQLSVNHSVITIPPQSFKWTITLDSSRPFSQGFDIPYGISPLSGSITLIQTHNHVTTYHIPLHGFPDLYCVLSILEIALIDGVYFPINYSFSFSPNNTLVLNLQFPPFNRSLFYDPFVAVGVLLPSDSNGNGNLFIICITVSISVVLILVIASSATAVGFWLHKKKLKKKCRDHVNFEIDQM